MSDRKSFGGIVVAASFTSIVLCAFAGCPQSGAVRGPDKTGKVAQNPAANQRDDTEPKDNSSTASKPQPDKPATQAKKSTDSKAAQSSAAKTKPTQPHSAPPKKKVAPIAPQVGGPAKTKADATPAAKSERIPSLAAVKSWKKPAVALVVTGRQHGYLEPCGCAGLDNQRGGLARRFALLNEVRSWGWEVAPLDAGNQVRRFGRQAEIKLQVTGGALRKMGYKFIALGPDDIRLPGGELVSLAADGGFVAANVAILDPSFIPPARIHEAGGLRLGVTAVLGDFYQRGINNEDVTLKSAEQGVKIGWQTLEQKKCDVRILIAHATLDETKKLGKLFPFDLVITTGGLGEPTNEPIQLNGKTRMIQVGTKGQWAGVVAFYGKEQPFKYRKIPLNAEFKDSPAGLNALKLYQDELKQSGFKGLQVKAIPHPSGDQYVGSAVCGSCHKKAYDIWKDGPHSHATESIAHPSERFSIARHFDPECLSCHVTGWNPQKFFPYTSGFLNYDANKTLLHGNGCENCHGPGKKHADAERNRGKFSAAQLKSMRQKMVLTLETARKVTCYKCHDTDNDPNFGPSTFDDYWEQIVHEGKN